MELRRVDRELDGGLRAVPRRVLERDERRRQDAVLRGALDLAQALAFVRGEGGDEDEADDVLGIGRGVRDHRTAVRVADGEDGPGNLVEKRSEVGGVMEMPRSGIAGAVTSIPAACRRSTTPFQLEASAKAPWTRTTVRGALSDRESP